MIRRQFLAGSGTALTTALARQSQGKRPLKIAYDLLLWGGFRHIKPPEER